MAIRARARVLTAAVAVSCLLTACGSSSIGSSSTSYSIADKDASATGCRSDLVVGDHLAFDVQIRNATGHAWGVTYVFLQDDGLTRDGFVDAHGETAQNAGAGQFRFTGLRSGESRRFTARFTASQVKTFTMAMHWYGSSKTSGPAHPPSSTFEVACTGYARAR